MAQFLVNALVVLIVIGAVAAAVVGWKALVSYLKGMLSILWSQCVTFAGRWVRTRHPLGVIGLNRSRRDGSLADLQEQLLTLVYGRCRRSRRGSFLSPTMVAVACHEADYATLTQAHDLLERELTDDLRRWEPSAKPVKVVLSSALTATRGRLRVTSVDFGAATVEFPAGTTTYAKTRVDVPSAASLQYSTGEKVPLRREGMTIGREGDLRLSDSKVSRRHARVLCAGGSWSIRDMESLNGTKVNGSIITKEARLEDGDRVCIGDTVLTFRLSAAPEK